MKQHHEEQTSPERCTPKGSWVNKVVPLVRQVRLPTGLGHVSFTLFCGDGGANFMFQVMTWPGPHGIYYEAGRY